MILGINWDVWYFLGLMVFLFICFIQTGKALVRISENPKPTKRLKETPMDSVRVLLLAVPMFVLFGYLFYKQWFAENKEPDLWTMNIYFTAILIYGGSLACWGAWDKRKRAKDPNNWIEIENTVS